MIYSILANTINSIRITPAPSSGISIDDITITSYPNLVTIADGAISIDLPPTAVAGDVVFIYANTDWISSTRPLSIPTGWTEHFWWGNATSDNSGNLWSKTIDATDVSNGYVETIWIVQSTTRDILFHSFIGTGVDASNPVSDVGTIKISDQGTSMTVNGITPTYDGLALGFWGYDGGDGEPTTLNAGWTKLAEQECDPTLSGLLGGFASKETTAGVATGNLIVTFQVSDGYGGIIVNLKQV